MSSGYEPIRLETINGGQLVALFDRELSRVLENIADDNTAAKTVRSITLTVKMRPEDDRGSVVVEIDSRSKLAPVKPSRSHAVLAFDGQVITAYQSDVRQLKLGEPENEGTIRKFDQYQIVGEGR